MAGNPLEYWYWSVPTKARPGQRRKTRRRLSEEEARRLYGEAAEKIPGSLELRYEVAGTTGPPHPDHGIRKARDAYPAKGSRATGAIEDSAASRHKGARDRARVRIDEYFEMQFWMEELGVSEATLIAAVEAVGTDPIDVKQYLLELPPAP